MDAPRGSTGIVERAAERFLAGPEFERLVVLTVDSPAIEHAVASVFESRLLDQVVARLLAGPELWRLVDEVARSPAVMDAMAHQGAGFADQVAGEVRDRSRSADAVVERTTRRLLRRRPRMDPPTGPLPNPGASCENERRVASCVRYLERDAFGRPLCPAARDSTRS